MSLLLQKNRKSLSRNRPRKKAHNCSSFEIGFDRCLGISYIIDIGRIANFGRNRLYANWNILQNPWCRYERPNDLGNNLDQVPSIKLVAKRKRLVDLKFYVSLILLISCFNDVSVYSFLDFVQLLMTEKYLHLRLSNCKRIILLWIIVGWTNQLRFECRKMVDFDLGWDSFPILSSWYSLR